MSAQMFNLADPRNDQTPPQEAVDYSVDRNKLIAKVHIAKAQLGWDDDTYRETLARVTGKSSAKDLNIKELEAVLKAFAKSGFKALPSRHTKGAPPAVYKISALWFSGYNLGVIQDPSPAAMEAFILRQTGLAKAQWLINAADTHKVIDGLKAWLARAAHVDWKIQKGVPEYMNLAQYRVVAAQWLALRGCGSATAGHRSPEGETSITAEVMDYAQALLKKPPQEMNGKDFLKVQIALGKKLRNALELK
jgi:phage gp16-like protein